MTPDELQQQEELGRKIAAALAPLGLNRPTILQMVRQDYLTHLSTATYRNTARRHPDSYILPAHGTEWKWARSAGVAAYFEEQGK